MATIYKARWVLPGSSPAIENGAVAVEGPYIRSVGAETDVLGQFPAARIVSLGDAIIAPGLVNTHTHLELTAMRGYLEDEERDFFAWLRKLTLARLELMTPDDIVVSATWGACEAARAGITCVGDASDAASMTMEALQQVGLRGIVFQESFGPDPLLARENFEKLKAKVMTLRQLETDLIKVGVSPHAPYTVCGPQLESIAQFAVSEGLPLMMHAAESEAEESFVRDGSGIFAEGLARRGINWSAVRSSTIQYLKEREILNARPVLAHCIRVDQEDIETLLETGSKVAHCPKSNAKLGHGRAPLSTFLRVGVTTGLGSDSVASNNTCDLLEEARFAALLSRAEVREGEHWVTAREMLEVATNGGARCLELHTKVGQLKEGFQADLMAISLAGVHEHPMYNPLINAIFSSSSRDVILTVVAGAEVYGEGRLNTVDEYRLRARMDEIRAKLETAGG